jgi:hypothetical protein
VGAAVFGAVVNHGLGDAGQNSIDRLMEPVTRAELDAEDLSALTDLLAAALHDVYAIGVVLAVATLAISLAVPRGLKP